MEEAAELGNYLPLSFKSTKGRRDAHSSFSIRNCLVAANRELIARFEKKIQATLARVWGESAL